MKAIKIREEISKLFDDPTHNIPEDHLNNTCKIKDKKNVCIYLMLLRDKFVCCKNTPIKSSINNIVNESNLKVNDNCEGL
jgi:hypothetical protein